MLGLDYEGKFLKNLKLCEDRGYEIRLLDIVVNLLRKNIPLPKRHKDHKLHGKFVGYRDCHIKNDWVLVYKKTKTHIVLASTGTHSDIFG